MNHKVLLPVILMTIGLAGPAVAESPLFTDFSGQPRDIEDYAGQGKWLVVKIWAHDCHVCNQEAEGYAQFHEAHKDKDATVLGVSLDGQANQDGAEAYIERHELAFPNLIGEPETVMLKYLTLTQTQFRGTPTILLYDPEGTLRAAQPGAVSVEAIEAYMAKKQTEPADPG